jgi:hypothetical protein
MVLSNECDSKQEKNNNNNTHTHGKPQKLVHTVHSSHTQNNGKWVSQSYEIQAFFLCHHFFSFCELNCGVICWDHIFHEAVSAHTKASQCE